MSPETYKLLHVIGALALFLGLGGMFASEAGKGVKLFAMFHGIGMLLLLVAGIGRAHRLGYGWPPWMLAKIACWLVIGALPTLVKRGVLPRVGALLLALGLGALAVWLAQAKPF